MTKSATPPTQPRIRVGPAGWSYPDWGGIVYPQRSRGGGGDLARIASWFDLAEINMSFYRIPTPEMAGRWLRQVDSFPAFRFTAKLHRKFTHERAWTRMDVEAFRSFLTQLAESGRLEAVLAQFPWSFRNDPSSRSALLTILDCFPDVPVAVEMRHASWWEESFFRDMSDRSAAVVNIDQPALRDNVPPAEVLTAPLAYIRFHGRNAANWWLREEPYHGARYDYLYSHDELEPWMDRINRLSQQAQSTIIVMNNHHRGDAVLNGMEVAARLGLLRGSIPRGLLELHPRRAGALPIPAEQSEPMQTDLFSEEP